MSSNFKQFGKKYNQGIFLVLVLVLGAIFFAITSAFVGYINTQSQVVTQRYILDRSGEIAEAGLNYFKWYLHHNTSDITAALPPGGTLTQTYTDVSGDSVGEFTLTMATTTYCGEISSIDVISTGHSYIDPSLVRTVSSRFMRPTVANYSYILDSPFVWAGADRQIYGPYHSNGQIRMDGTNYSIVSSEIESQSGDDGVYTTTANANTALFVFPTLEIPFDNFVNDLDDIEDAALNHGGYHKTSSPDGHGYLVEFIGGGQMRVTDVRRTHSYWARYVNTGNWFTEDNIIRDLRSSTEDIWNINPDCPVVFFDDRIWLTQDDSNNKKLDEMITIVSSETIVLQGNIQYEDSDEDGLLAIAEDDVLVGVDVPDDMELNGIFVAQTGSFGRNFYSSSYLPSGYGSYDYLNSLTINGTIVSKGRVGTKWGTSSGFANRVNQYNRDLVNNPPPLVPNTSSNYSLVDWKEAD